MKLCLSLIILVVVVIYLPLSFHFLSLRNDQISSGINPETALPVYDSDSYDYTSIADNILFHKSFIRREISEKSLPDTFRTPVYPTLLSIFKFLTGSFTLFPFIQIFLAACTAFLIFKIGEKFFSAVVGVAASLFYLLDPTVILYSLILMTDILFVFLIIAGVYILFVKKFSNEYYSLLFSGLLFGLATLTRPISMYAPVLFLLPMYVFIKRNEWSKRKILIGISIFLFVFVSTLSPWMIRNKIVSGVWGISSVSAYNLYHYNAPEFLTFKNKIGREEARKIVEQNLSTEDIARLDTVGATSLALSPAIKKAAFKVIFEDPVGYTYFHLIKTLPVFLSSSLNTFFTAHEEISHKKIITTTTANLTNLIMSFDFKGIYDALKASPLVSFEKIMWILICILISFSLYKKENRTYTILFLLFILYFALLTGPVAYSRFRLPAEPFMALLAFYGLSEVIKFSRRLIFNPKTH